MSQFQEMSKDLGAAVHQVRKDTETMFNRAVSRRHAEGDVKFGKSLIELLVQDRR